METLVREKPILFSGEMVRAVLDGRKTQTRRVVKPQSRIILHDNGQALTDSGWLPELDNPYGKPGDQLWVRETWATSLSLDQTSPAEIAVHAHYAGYNDGNHPLADLWYIADMHYRQWGDEKTSLGKSRPSIHMPRWASRIQLEVTDVRVERVQDISEKDMVAEGIVLKYSDYEWFNRSKFSSEQFFGFDLDQAWIDLWNSINEKRGFGWDVNPWVWVVEFKMIKP